MKGIFFVLLAVCGIFDCEGAFTVRDAVATLKNLQSNEERLIALLNEEEEVSDNDYCFGDEDESDEGKEKYMLFSKVDSDLGKLNRIRDEASEPVRRLLLDFFEKHRKDYDFTIGKLNELSENPS